MKIERIIRRITLLFCVMLAMLTFVSCSKDNGNEPTAAKGSIYGIVSNSNGTILPNVTVTLAVETEKYVDYGDGYSEPEVVVLLKTVTSEDGSYEFKNLEPGTYILVVEVGNEEPWVMKVSVQAGRQARVDICW